ncbi:MAG: penicillin-binding protein 2 [Actinobacteria bacterium]|nr:MAG: penicillin-binding protein 2 [Actinomycetota bacterium]
MMSLTESPRLRLGVLGIVAFSLFAVMFARLWYLQVLAAPTYKVQAEGNRIRLVAEPAPRGRILDRNGKVLVDNRVSEIVAVNRAELNHPRQVLERLALLLGKPESELASRLDDPRFSPYKPIPVAEDVPKAAVIHIREQQSDFPGVVAGQVAERSYPNGTLAAHLLGYVGEVNDQELAQHRAQGYRLGDNIGKSGIEQIYEDELRGRPGIDKLEVDSKGRVLRTLGHQDPVQGDDVQLTIDLDLQKLAEDSLAQGLDAAHKAWDKNMLKHFVAPAGAVVVLDPRDGSVVALASNPTYDPAAFVNGIKPALFRALQDPNGHYPLTDRAIQGQYAPGSTFKLFTAIAALERGLITPATTIVDNGSLRVGNRIFKNAGGRAYGPVNLAHALTVSSDVYFYSLGNAFWAQRSRFGDGIQATAHELGLGERTGIALPYEAIGRVPDPTIRKRLHDQNPKAFPNGKWFSGDNVNLAIGQGELVVTPLQLANAYATFANGGTVYSPRVAQRVLRDGKPVREISPVVAHRVSLPPAVRDPILQGLVGAVAGDKGTAHGAFIGFPYDRFPVAGKTGTAQVLNKQDTALFVAFAPADSPQYVVTVVIEEAGFGAQSAAPVARRILDGIAGLAPAQVNQSSGVD